MAIAQLVNGSQDKRLGLLCSAVLWLYLALNVSAAEDVVTKSGGADAASKNVPSTLFGNISVSGGNQQVRGGIASAANELRVQFNKLCGDSDREMKLPVIIKLHGVEGDDELSRSIVSKISTLQGQYQLLLHIHLAKGVDQYSLRYHLMELLLYERGLADDQFVGEGDRLNVKPWLITGMLESIDIRSADYDRSIYQSDLDFLSILSVEKVFEMTENQSQELIGHESVAFRVISGAIVNSLLRQPSGKSAMSTYLADFATFKGEYENLLRKHFPGMNKSSNSLSKWVNLELLELSTAQVTQVHSILETESRLDGILRLHYRDTNGLAQSVEVVAYNTILELEPGQRFEAVAAARAELERLSYRCFPTYRPILNEYELILRGLANGKTKNTRSRLDRLMEVRTRMKAAAVRSRDYLDWYYITQSRELGGDFDKYRALNDAIQKELLRPAVGDATGNYLDQIQRIYGSKF